MIIVKVANVDSVRTLSTVRTKRGVKYSYRKE
jgi:hypothetical protein